MTAYSQAASVLTSMQFNQADSCLLRDIHAEVIRVDNENVKSPGYVISISLPGRSTSTHYVSRTYSEWRQLYKTLLKYTNSMANESCDCVMGSCPFWTLFVLLNQFQFPKKTFFHRHSQRVLDERKRELSDFLSVVLTKLHVYRQQFFDRMENSNSSSYEHALPNWQLAKCKVLDAIEAFLGLDANIIGQLRTVGASKRLSMNLRGWQSDRKNLYFHPTAIVA
ncbi:hypothetical protein THRCLA_02872 [Thraustotheca clavata]|uniref:PX domain-containing protein n=1 Tax=Thraustotheca clavata TaxID=74557 RepID=A0A1W0A3Y2_9STRA|nr:hypothetical protein THRCLA_02872 [Thraustotheca clavata]